MAGFLILILIFGAVWLLFVLPARRRRMSHSAMQDTIAAGDDVITAGGIHGTVREIVDDLVQLEIAPGVVVQVDRRAIAAVAREVEVGSRAGARRCLQPDPAPEPIRPNPPAGRPRNQANLPARVISALQPDPDRPDRPRPRRRGVSGRPRLAGASWRQEGARSRRAASRSC